MIRRRFAFLLFLPAWALTGLAAVPLRAQEDDLRLKVIEIRGKVSVYRDETDETTRLHKGQTVDDGDKITTGSKCEVVLRLKGKGDIYLAPHTKVRVSRLEWPDAQGPKMRLNLITGRLLGQLGKAPSWAFEVSAGNVIARAHGSLFEFYRKRDDFWTVSYEGSLVANSKGHVWLAKPRQVMRFNNGRFRYTRYLQSDEKNHLAQWKEILKGLSPKTR